MSTYRDRIDAGKKLAKHLTEFARRDNLVVLALSRGGVPVAYEVAQALDVPMDVFVVRKLGVPGQEELAMGAIASGGIRIINETVVEQAGLSEKDIAVTAAQEQVVLERRERMYRGDRRSIDLQDQTVIVVDDGMATGTTMHAAALALRRLKPAEIVVAVPVASEEACAKLKQWADRVVCLETPANFRVIGQWYDDFSQTTDAEVLNYMDKAKED
jgi:predicted phosphoribosyltransferase